LLLAPLLDGSAIVAHPHRVAGSLARQPTPIWPGPHAGCTRSAPASGRAVDLALDHGAALSVDPALLDGGGQLAPRAAAARPSCHAPAAARAVGQPLAL